MTSTSTIETVQQGLLDLQSGDVDALRDLAIGDLALALDSMSDETLQTMTRERADQVLAVICGDDPEEVAEAVSGEPED